MGDVVGRCFEAARSLGPVRVMVGDNNSTDGTAAAARASGAEVVRVTRRGYGAACRGAIASLGDWPEVLVFMDADGSSRPEEIPRLLAPVFREGLDLVVGRRPPGCPMTPPQRWGTWLAVEVMALRWGRFYSDIGPFRAIRRTAFEKLGMRDQTWGWTVEMQVMALLQGLRVGEVPVSWEKRLAGVSKISGTALGVARAGARILWTLVRYSLQRRSGPAGVSPGGV